MINDDNENPVKSTLVSQDRLNEIAAIADEDIDFSDIPEQGEEFFKNARVYNRGVPVEIVFALDAGFGAYHTGGGLWALRRDIDGKDDDYVMITDETQNLESAPEEAVWSVGRYRTVSNKEAWVFVSEAVSLKQAIELATQVPVPDAAEPEKTFLEWSDIGFTIPEDGSSGPRM